MTQTTADPRSMCMSVVHPPGPPPEALVAGTWRSSRHEELAERVQYCLDCADVLIGAGVFHPDEDPDPETAASEN